MAFSLDPWQCFVSPRRENRSSVLVSSIEFICLSFYLCTFRVCSISFLVVTTLLEAARLGAHFLYVFFNEPEPSCAPGCWFSASSLP
jgi:hypothetical protein